MVEASASEGPAAAADEITRLPLCSGCRLGPACLPANLDTHALSRLQQIVRALPPLERAQSLFDGGGAGGHLFIVRSGSLRTSVQQATGDEQVLDFLLPGDVTGAGTGIESFGGGRAVALERTSVCAVSLAAARGLATRLEGLQEQLCRLFERAQVDNGHHVMAMGRPTAQGRVALFLYTWSRRRQAAGFPWADLYLPMRRDDLASYLGLVTETTSRAFSRLRRAGVIELPDRHRIRIHDAAALVDIAGVDLPADWGDGAHGEAPGGGVPGAAAPQGGA